MFRKLSTSVVVMTLTIGFVAAEEFTATIKKVEGDKVTFSKLTFKDKKAEKGEDMTLPAAPNVKVTKLKFNKEDKKVEAGEALEKGLKNEIFAKLGEKKDTEKKDKKFGFGGGVFAQITTSEDGKTITAINVMSFGGGFGKDKKKKTEDKKTDK